MKFHSLLWTYVCIAIALVNYLNAENDCNEGETENVSNDNKRLLLHTDTDVASELMALRAELTALRAQVTTAQVSGSVYVRWGRNVCPNGTEFIYNGYTAGKHYHNEGSGSDTICLVSDPIWDNYDNAHNGLRAAIYGTEIDIDVPSNIFAQNPNQQDMPCVVCRPPRPTSVMIPGRKECYPGWTREYWGFLMSAADSAVSEHNHICMDANPEYMQHGGTNDNQHIMYLVEARCGSLPCPPYSDGRELTCVVCSK
ncbi:hypothetical protein ACF0H5_005226 [Mactra antiquata]